MATYLPSDYQSNVTPIWSVVPAGSHGGIGGHRGATADEDRARYLIVSVLNDQPGRQALVDLAEQARDLGVVWIGTLGDELRRAGVVNSTLADELAHRFALLRIESGSEAQALREVFRFECRQTKKGKNEFLAVEPDYPLRYFGHTNIGANFDLLANGSSHNSYASMLKVNDAHNNGARGGGVTVAVVDSGVEKSDIASDFEDLQVPTNQTETDQNGHGTAMTSIIRAIAPDAKVIAIRISDGYPRMWKFMLGVSSASMEHTSDIINISMGLDSIRTACGQCGASSPGLSSNLEYFLEDISQKALGSNGPPLLVASAGNDGSSSDLSCPAKWNSTVAVGAINSSRVRSRFSNYGASSHPAFLVMPGGDEDAQGNVSEWAGRGNGAECVGTSLAAAYASGMLAVYASDPDYQTPNRETFLTDVLNQCDRTFTGHRFAEHGKGFLPYVKR